MIGLVNLVCPLMPVATPLSTGCMAISVAANIGAAGIGIR